MVVMPATQTVAGEYRPRVPEIMPPKRQLARPAKPDPGQ